MASVHPKFSIPLLIRTKEVVSHFSLNLFFFLFSFSFVMKLLRSKKKKKKKQGLQKVVIGVSLIVRVVLALLALMRWNKYDPALPTSVPTVKTPPAREISPTTN